MSLDSGRCSLFVFARLFFLTILILLTGFISEVLEKPRNPRWPPFRNSPSRRHHLILRGTDLKGNSFGRTIYPPSFIFINNLRVRKGGSAPIAPLAPPSTVGASGVRALCGGPGSRGRRGGGRGRGGTHAQELQAKCGKGPGLFPSGITFLTLSDIFANVLT